MMAMILEDLIAEYGIDAVLYYLIEERAEYDAIEFEVFLCDELGLDAIVELELA